jgi:hypothetical protein
MPLTLELIGSNPKNSGQLIIDRNNLIVAYYSDSSIESINNALSNRLRLGNLITESYEYSKNKEIAKKHPLTPNKTYAETDDPRHDALEHMSSYDRYECQHGHLIFKDDINFELIKLIFSNLKIGSHTDLISYECINKIISTSEEYFLELDTSDTAKRIEAEYREYKNREFEAAALITNYQENLTSSYESDVSLEMEAMQTEEVEIEKMEEEFEVEATTTREEIAFNKRLQKIRRALFLFEEDNSDAMHLSGYSASTASTSFNLGSGSESDYDDCSDDMYTSYQQETDTAGVIVSPGSEIKKLFII